MRALGAALAALLAAAGLAAAFPHGPVAAAGEAAHAYDGAYGACGGLAVVTVAVDLTTGHGVVQAASRDCTSFGRVFLGECRGSQLGAVRCRDASPPQTSTLDLAADGAFAFATADAEHRHTLAGNLTRV